MRAAVYERGGAVSVRDVPEPPLPGPAEVLVEMLACGICGSDLMTWYQDTRAPMVPGHEPVGRIIAAGDGASLPVGTRVFAHHHVPCLDCERCRAGRDTLCDRFRRTALQPGGLAERFLVPAENAALDLLEVPESVSDTAATLIEPLACVLRGQRLAGLARAHGLAVLGAGSMGIFQIQAARAAGVQRVVCVEPRADRRALAEEAGAVAVAGASADLVRSALGGALADVVIVCTHAPEAIAAALHLAAPGGVVQLFAPTRPGELVGLDLGAVFFSEVTLQSTYSAGPADTREALALIASGAVDLEPVVTHRVDLERIAEGFALARSGEALKVVVTARAE